RVEDRGEARAGVDRLPDAARGGDDVPGRLVPRVDRDVADAAGRDGRSDRAQLEPGERAGVERVLGFGLVLRKGEGGGGEEREGEDEESRSHGEFLREAGGRGDVTCAVRQRRGSRIVSAPGAAFTREGARAFASERGGEGGAAEAVRPGPYG